MNECEWEKEEDDDDNNNKIVLVTYIKAQVLSYMKWLSLDTVKFDRLICLCV